MSYLDKKRTVTLKERSLIFQYKNINQEYAQPGLSGVLVRTR